MGLAWQDTARSWLHQAEAWVYYHALRKKKEQRVRRFTEVMHPKRGEMLLDVGAGTGDFWLRFGGLPELQGVRMAALDLNPINNFSVFRWRIVADARKMPFRDGAFDIVFSNSVIEHVGDFGRQQLMSSEIRRVAKRYFVQVPAKWFPIEPHYFIPFLSYLPVKWQVALTKQLFGVGDPIHLPTRRIVHRLFPSATIEVERMLGLPKAYLIHNRGDVEVG